MIPRPGGTVPPKVGDADPARAGLKPIKVHKFLPEQYFVVYAAERASNVR